jgi:hypothetical protein
VIYCKACRGKLYEEDIFKADDDVVYMEIGCYTCPAKVHVPLKKWNKFKQELTDAIVRQRREKIKATA